MSPQREKLQLTRKTSGQEWQSVKKKTFPLPPFNHQHSYSVETVECKTICVKSVFFFFLHCIIAYASRTRSLIHFFLIITFYRFNICNFTFYKHLIKDTILFS